ncbi:MAG: flippase-like domain-containing protein [Candidatus Rokubacteria bacterium]|nr:flippase-like domain-containing protein [Candidatus Rokubacteria bacterium]
MAYKWWLLLRVLEPRIGWWRSLGAYYAATFAGLFLPSTLGSDVVRTLSLRRNGVRTVDMAISIVLERILGILPAGLMALGSLFLLHIYGKDNAGLAALVITLLLCLVGGSLALSFWAPGLEALQRASWSRLRGVGKTLAQGHDAYREFHHRAPVLLAFVALSLIEQGFPLVIAALAARALGVRIPPVYLLAALPPVLLFSRLPISVGGLGVQEGSFIYMLSLFDIPSTQALSVILLSNVLLVLSLFPMAIWHFIESPRRAGIVPQPPGVVGARGADPPGSDPG